MRIGPSDLDSSSSFSFGLTVRKLTALSAVCCSCRFSATQTTACERVESVKATHSIVLGGPPSKRDTRCTSNGVQLWLDERWLGKIPISVVIRDVSFDVSCSSTVGIVVNEIHRNVHVYVVIVWTCVVNVWETRWYLFNLWNGRMWFFKGSICLALLTELVCFFFYAHCRLVTLLNRLHRINNIIPIKTSLYSESRKVR